MASLPGNDSGRKESTTLKHPSHRLNSTFTFFRSFHHLKSVSTLLKSTVKDGGVPYVAVHEGNSSALPKDFRASYYRGLLFCHIIKHNDTQYLFSYWQSEDAFKSYGPRFIAENTYGDGCEQSGRFSDYRVKEDPWWLKYHFWTVVITLSALVGGFLSLWERGGQLLESPDVYIEMAVDHPNNLLNTSIGSNAIKFSLTNRCRFAALSVDVKSAFVRPETQGNADLKDITRLSRIEPGLTKDFFVGPALSVLGQNEIPRSYEFRLEAKAYCRAGAHEIF
jgi:hypothetical protein